MKKITLLGLASLLCSLSGCIVPAPAPYYPPPPGYAVAPAPAPAPYPYGYGPAYYGAPVYVGAGFYPEYYRHGYWGGGGGGWRH